MKEDVRATLSVKENFYDIVFSLYQKKAAANILYDDNGITRANGKIKEISERNDSSFLILDNDTKVNIASIIAVNGVFGPDYSEC